MITIKNYVRVGSLDEAFQLNQSKRNCVLGGMLWLRTGNRTIDTAIDLGNLKLDTIEEREDCFRIGSMVSLRSLEKSEKLNSFFGNVFEKAVCDIVGVQFRNLATVGGSIWGRYGFSDVLTVFLSTDSYVELYHGGIVRLEDFIRMPKDNDILVRIIINKTPGLFTYESVRIQKTDLPVITCAVSRYNGDYFCTVGARPSAAVKVKDDQHILDNGISPDTARRFAAYVSFRAETGTNMRGSKEYRKQLIRVLTERLLVGMGEVL